MRRGHLEPIRYGAKLPQRHVNELLSYFWYPITYAAAEGFDSRICAIKSAAGDFHAFANERARILFHCACWT